MLAAETTVDVAVAGVGLGGGTAGEILLCSAEVRSPLRDVGTRVRRNLWFLPLEANEVEGSAVSLHRYIGEVRREFEYSILAAPAAAISSHAMTLAQLADGIVLVLSAQRTRRVQARKVKTTLEQAQARLLGTVLSDREFPIPERIYRRL